MAKNYLGVGKDMGGARVTSVGTPTAGTDAVTKNYADGLIQGLSWKQAVRAASTANVSVSSAPSSLDGVTLVAGDRVLLKNQTTPAENGIYTWNGVSVAMTRTPDADAAAELANASVSVTEGTTLADTQWVQTTNLPITLNTTALAFVQLGGGSAGFTVAGNGLTSSGATVDVGAGTGILANANDVAIDTSIVSRKVSFNVGDGSSTAITLAHALGTRDVSVTVYRNSTPYDEVDVDVVHDTTANVILTFASAPASNAFRAIVQG